MKQIYEKHALEINYRYVPTGENPANLLSKSISTENYVRTWNIGHSDQNG